MAETLEVNGGEYDADSAVLSQMAAILNFDGAALERRIANDGGIPCPSERKQDRSFVLGRIASGQLFQDVKVVDVLEAIISIEKIEMNDSVRDALVGFLSGAADAVDERAEGLTDVVVLNGGRWSICPSN